MRAPAAIKPTGDDASGRLTIQTTEQQEIAAWKVRLLAAHKAERGDNEFSDKPPPRVINTLFRKSIEDELRRELPRLATSANDAGRARQPILGGARLYGPVVRAASVDGITLRDYELSGLQAGALGLSLIGSTFAVFLLLMLLWLLGTSPAAL